MYGAQKEIPLAKAIGMKQNHYVNEVTELREHITKLIEADGKKPSDFIMTMTESQDMATGSYVLQLRAEERSEWIKKQGAGRV